MEVNYMVLADAAEAINGKHYLLGGGFDTISAAQVPATHPNIAVAIRIDVPWTATSQEHRLELDIIDEDERSILGNHFNISFESGRPPTMRSEDKHAVVMVFNFINVTFQRYGRYHIVCRLDGNEEARQTIKIATSG